MSVAFHLLSTNHSYTGMYIALSTHKWCLNEYAIITTKQIDIVINSDSTAAISIVMSFIVTQGIIDNISINSNNDD
jgi:hypothetical protein